MIGPANTERGRKRKRHKERQSENGAMNQGRTEERGLVVK
jgi:hypothetical protein